MTFALDGDRLVSAVDAKPKRTHALKRLANISHEPRVSVLIDAYEEEWSGLWWCRMDGRAEVVRDGPDRDEAVARLQAKYEQYRLQAPEGPVVVVHVTRWSGWSAS
jgi:PPOX class probable F420-dependent enzyme